MIDDRNCIIHSIPTGEKVDNYVIPIYRNDSKNKYIRIDKEFLKNCSKEKMNTVLVIKENEKLNNKIHKFRGY